MRVGDGFVRTDVDGAVTYASPNALSAFRRLGLTGDLVASTWPGSPASWCRRSEQPVDEAITAVVSGRSPRAAEVENAIASLVVRAMPLLQRGGLDRVAAAAARRHRAAPPRARAGDQGGDHPRDPPPGEEQPADGGGAAAAAVAADGRTGGEGGAGGGHPPGRRDRAGARDAQPVVRRVGRLRRGRRPAPGDGGRGLVSGVGHGQRGPGYGHVADAPARSARCRPSWPSFAVDGAGRAAAERRRARVRRRTGVRAHRRTPRAAGARGAGRGRRARPARRLRPGRRRRAWASRSCGRWWSPSCGGRITLRQPGTRHRPGRHERDRAASAAADPGRPRA